MLRQKQVTVKTDSATLTYAEMGEILCNSSNDETYTLPTAAEGLWYNFVNKGSGLVTISNGTELAVLKQKQQCLVLSSGGSWEAFASSIGGVETLNDFEGNLDLIAGDNIEIANDNGEITIAAIVPEDPYYEVMANGEPSDPQVLFDFETGDIIAGEVM